MAEQLNPQAGLLVRPTWRALRPAVHIEEVYGVPAGQDDRVGPPALLKLGPCSRGLPPAARPLLVAELRQAPGGRTHSTPADRRRPVPPVLGAPGLGPGCTGGGLTQPRLLNQEDVVLVSKEIGRAHV